MLGPFAGDGAYAVTITVMDEDEFMPGPAVHAGRRVHRGGEVPAHLHDGNGRRVAVAQVCAMRVAWQLADSTRRRGG